MPQQFDFTGVSKLTMVHEKTATKSSHVKTGIRLEISKNLDKRIYLDEEELPTKEGIKPLTLCFTHGLIANIHKAHEEGWWDSADHLRYIISELERGFVSVATVRKSTI